MRSLVHQFSKRKVIYLTFKLKVLLCLMLSQPSLAQPLKVVIDPGHGGTDAGAVRGHHRESDIVLQVSKLVIDKLGQDRRFKVNTTRTKDRTMSLQERVKITKKYNPDLFLSIHANSHYNFKAQGAEIYIQDKIPVNKNLLSLTHKQMSSLNNGKASIISSILEDLKKVGAFYEGLELAKVLKNQWDKQMPSPPTHIKKSPLYILKELDMPAVLVEVGFLSHISEGHWLMESRAHDEIANIIYKSLIKYKEKLDKQNLPTHITAHAKR